MSYTLKDIAKKTGVSISTVSRVLHDDSKKYKISDETTARIKSVAKDLGYRVNALARGLRQQKTSEIGIVVPDISNPFFSEVVKNLATLGRRHNPHDEESPGHRRHWFCRLRHRARAACIGAAGEDSASCSIALEQPRGT